MGELRRSFGFQLAVDGNSDVGRVRTNNEDSWGASWLDDGSLFVIVADGMGGHEAGEVASGLAVQVVEDVASRDADADPRERLFDALIEANQVILEEGNRSGTRGMGTTAVTAILKGAEAYVALVGDSRCYLIRHGQIVWRTLDHTRVQMLVDNGDISEEEAKSHPEAGMLTRALGHSRMADGRPLEPDVLEEPLYLEEKTDTLLFCSDGLTDLVDDWEIGQIVAGKTGDEAISALIELACDRGGHDNVTIAIVNTGLRAADYDENYVPETWEDYNETYDEQGHDQGPNTYDDMGAGAPPPAPAPQVAAAPYAGTPAQTPQYAPEEAAGGNTMLIAGVGAVLVLVFGVMAFALLVVVLMLALG